MTPRSPVILSLGLNVLLLAAGWRGGRPQPPAPIPPTPAAVDTDAPPTPVRTAVSVVEVTVTNDPPPFHWDQVRSPDLQRYGAALRAMGCPRDTVRDILGGELEEEFMARRRVLIEPWERRYWDHAVRGLGGSMKEYREPLRALHQQTVGRLDGLLGALGLGTERKVEHSLDTRLGYLPAGKQAQVTELMRRLDEEQGTVQREGGLMTDERRARLAALEARRQEGLRGLLTAEELEEYRLRTSRYAGAGQRPGFAASAEELRLLTRTLEQYRAADESLDRRAPDYPVRRQQQEDLRRQRDEALRNALGEARYAEYERGNDSGFQELHHVGERYGLPQESVHQANEVRRLAQESLQRVRRDPALTPEQRQAMQAAVQEETRAELARLLGEAPARTYERNGGEWLRKGR